MTKNKVDEAKEIVENDEDAKTIVKAEKITAKKQKKEAMKEGRKKAEKAIPLSRMKPNSDMLDAGIDTSKEYMTKDEKEEERKAKEKKKK